MGKEQNNQRGGWQGFMCLSKNYCRTNSWKWHSQDDNSTSQPSVVQALDHSTRSGLREEAGRVAGSDQQGRIQSPAWKKSQHFSSRHFHHRNNSTKLCPKVIFWFPRGLDDANCSDLIKLLLWLSRCAHQRVGYSLTPTLHWNSKGFLPLQTS